MINFFQVAGVTIETGNPLVDQLLQNPSFGLLLLLAAAVICAVAIFFLIRGFLTKTYNYLSSANLVVLLVTMPKESAKIAREEKLTLANLQENISIAETLYSLLGGLRKEKGAATYFRGRQDSFSFEIIARNNLISFYLAIPKNLKQYFENQVHAVYPEANLEEVEDYNLFTPQGMIKGGYLKFSREYIFPLKTYKKSETDPLNSLTNVLSKVEKDEGAAIQIILRSSNSGWRQKAHRVATEMQQGKRLSEALASVGLTKKINKFFSVFGWLLASFKTTKQNEQFPKTPDNLYRLSPLEEEMIKGIEEKVSKAGLEANIRILVTSPEASRTKILLENILNAFSQFNLYQYGNTLKAVIPAKQNKLVGDFIYRNFDYKFYLLLNTEELASIYHLPLPTTETPNIRWLTAKRTPPPVNLPTSGLVLGLSVYRGQEQIVRIKDEDRRRHIYSVGMTGTGKSNLLANLAIQDIKEGRGVCVIDPHGDLVEDCLGSVPPERLNDVIYFNPADSERPLGVNLLEYDLKYPEQKTFVINEMIKIFDKLYDLKQTGGPMFEQYMRNAMLLVMEDPASGSTLMEIPKVLSDSEFRNYKLSKCHNPVVYDFWTKEAQKAGGEAALANLVPYITSKLTQFISNDVMRPIIAQQKSAFNFRKIMDEGKILLINLSKGKLGDINSYLLGMMIVGKILMASLSRVDLSLEKRRDFYLYIDEFQNFITDSIAVILSEARKYCLNLTLAHQYIGQMVNKNDTTIRDAIFGNVGTIICFRIGVEDAEILAKQLMPVVNQFDLMNIEKYHAYARLLIDNTASRAFLMKCLPPVLTNPETISKLKELSRQKYGLPREIIETEINQRLQIIKKTSSLNEQI